MPLRPLHLTFAILTASTGVLTAVLFASGLLVPGVLGAVALVGSIGGWANAARRGLEGALPRPTTAATMRTVTLAATACLLPFEASFQAKSGTRSHQKSSQPTT